MKKFFTICMMLIAGFATMSAQQYSDRILVHQTSGQVTGFLAERVDSLSFPQVEGRVAADVEIVSNTEEALTINITRTQACAGFMFTVISESYVNWYKGDVLVEYVKQSATNTYRQDFTNAAVSGMELTPGSTYYIATLGLDMYDIPCELVLVPFVAPTPGLVGNPKVETTVTGTTKNTFSLHFVPNADTSEYYFVSGETGSIQSQYNMFAAWMGFTCMGDLIKGWGIAQDAEFDYTYTGMNPGTEYEVFVQPVDVNGTYANYDVVTVSTDAIGGTGEAKVDVTLGAYEMTDGWWDNDLATYVSKPSQMITFTPNADAACWRYVVALKANYDADPEGYNADVMSEPPMPSMVGWFQYDELTTDFQIDPETEYVIVTAAKNALGEWGPVSVINETTPALNVEAKAPQQKVDVRKQHNFKVNTTTPGRVPANLKKNPAGIQLIQK